MTVLGRRQQDRSLPHPPHSWRVGGKPTLNLPVRPDLVQLRHREKCLLQQIRRNVTSDIAGLIEHHPEQVHLGSVRLANAQLALARGYGIPSWSRLVLACRVIDAIWLEDADALKVLLLKHRRSVHEMSRVTGRYE